MSPRRNPFRRRPRSAGPYPHHNDDTAPFDVAALLAALADDDDYPYAGAAIYRATFNDDNDPVPAPADDSDHHPADYRTHYYGDNCPGGHYDDEYTPHYNS